MGNSGSFLRIEERYIDTLVLVSILLPTLIIYFYGIWRGNLVVGIDAPYYLMQVHNILHNGYMLYPDPPITFYVLSIITYFIKDEIIAFAFGNALLSTLSVIPIYFLVKKITNSRILAVVSILYILCSANYIRMLGDFVKSQFSILFLGLFLLELYNRERKQTSRTLLLILLILLTLLTHILSFCMAIFILFFYLIVVYGRGSSDKPALYTLVVIAILAIIGFFMLPFYFSDLTRITGFINRILNAKTLIVTSNKILPPTIQNCIIIFASFIYIIYSHKEKDLSNMTIFIPLVLLVIALSLPLNTGWNWRLLQISVIPASIIIGTILSSLQDRTAILIVGLLILSTIAMGGINQYYMLKPTITQAEYIDIVQMQKYINSSEIVVLHVHPIKHYWFEYLLKTKIYMRPPQESKIFYAIVPKDKIIKGTVIYIGRIYKLIQVIIQH